VEFLVEFEVNVPSGTAESDVEEREQAEAVAAAKLSAEGHLERLWRKSVASCQDAVLGLYCADGATELSRLLSALPLYEWMDVVVTPLDPHPNDPTRHGMDPTATGRAGGSVCRMERSAGTEYLVTMTTHVPDGTAADAVEAIRAREAARSAELAAEGHLLRLWRPPLEPGEWRTLGLFAARDDVELEQVLKSMPLRLWRTDTVAPLGSHPNDPASHASVS
jgi:muconolactone delta-isomerase